MWDDDGSRGREPGKSVSAAQSLGEGEPRVEAKAREAPRHVGEERPGAAEEMGNAGNVEPQPVVAIDVERRAVAARPVGKREEAVSILVGLGGGGQKRRAHGARIG